MYIDGKKRREKKQLFSEIIYLPKESQSQWTSSLLIVVSHAETICIILI